MPADPRYDTTHELAKKSDYRASCHSDKKIRNPQPGYYGTNRRYDEYGHWTLVQAWIPHTMTKPCQQDGLLAECKGCTNRSLLT